MSAAVFVVHQKGLPCRYLCRNRKQGFVWREGREHACEFPSWKDAEKTAREFSELHRVWISASREACRHNFVEAVDDDGRLIEPAQDVCVNCGETR